MKNENIENDIKKIFNKIKDDKLKKQNFQKIKRRKIRTYRRSKIASKMGNYGCFILK